MFTLRNVTLRREGQVLIQQADWTVYPKQRIGIVGKNGCGKTTLMSMFLGQLLPDEGEFDVKSNTKIAYVAQETPALNQTAIDFVMSGDDELQQVLKQLTRAEAEQDGNAIAILHDKLAAIDGYTAQARAGEILAGLGFSAKEQEKTVAEFSGGWRVRLNLAKALMCRSDILLLDEPTNHLDIDAVTWFEKWLASYQGCLLIISHDRDFLDETVEYIVLIAHQQIHLYTGNYSEFEKRRAEQLLLQQAAYEKQQKQIGHMQSYVERFRYKASKAKQAQSRLKAIERMNLVSAVHATSAFQFKFKQAKQMPNPLIKLANAQIAYGERVVLDHINLSIAPKDRLALLGPNGAGKSSLIKLLAGLIEPSKGEREVAPGLKIGYFAQHQVDALNLSASAINHLRDLNANATELELRQYLGSFAFHEDKVFADVKTFSGGEKARLALALIVWQQPNLLLLDEPTNHLDLDMRSALSIALQAYEGAVILVSHDRFLVRATVDELLMVVDGRVQTFDGDLHDYQNWLLQYRKETRDEKNDKSGNTRRLQRQQAAQAREDSRELNLKIKQLEKDILTYTKKLQEITQVLTSEEVYQLENKAKLQQLLINEAQLKKELSLKENEWLLACEQRENQ